MQVTIKQIKIGDRKRSLKTESVNQLAESIKEIGLLNPITITQDKRLISGMHRLEAVKLLGWTTIDCNVLHYNDALHEELIEIDENLIRNDLTVLEQGQQLNRRDEILSALGLRREVGGNGANQFQSNSELNSPKLKSTEDIAQEIGISKRTAQHYKQIDRDIDDSVKDMIRDTDVADNKTDLLKIAREKTPETQRKVANHIINKPHVTQNAGYYEWYTGEEYIKSARFVMGDIDLDPASSKEANEVIKATKFYSIDDNGLDKEWAGRVWMNPPYATDLITKFAQKLHKHVSNRDITEAIILINNATETKWFNIFIDIATAVCFPEGRLKYWRTDGKTSTPLQGQAFIYVGQNIDKFSNEFKQYGWIAKL